MSSEPPFSASAATSRLCGAHLCTEYDGEEREAELYLFTRPVDAALPDDVVYHHWVLVFHFAGNDFRTAEGFGGENDMLYPVYTKESPREQGKYFILGKVSSSPAKVLQLTKANPHNNTAYSATWQNCQTWVKAIAAMLGPDIARQLDDYNTLRDAMPLFALAGKMSSVSSRYFPSFRSSR